MTTKAPGGWTNHRFADDEIHHIDPTQLLAHPSNARRHEGPQREAIRESVDRLGVIAPLTVNVQTDTVLDGHMRIEEAITAGASTVPVVFIDVTPEEEARILASFDAIGAMATWEGFILADLLEQAPIESQALAGILAEEAKVSPYADDDLDRFGGGGGGGGDPEGGGGGEWENFDGITLCLPMTADDRATVMRWLQWQRSELDVETTAQALIFIARAAELPA